MIFYIQLFVVVCCVAMTFANSLPLIVPFAMMILFDSAVPSKSYLTIATLAFIVFIALLLKWIMTNVVNRSVKQIGDMSLRNYTQNEDKKIVSMFFAMIHSGSLWQIIDIFISILLIIFLMIQSFWLGGFLLIISMIALFGRIFFGENFNMLSSTTLPVTMMFFVAFLTITGSVSIGAITSSMFLSARVITSALSIVNSYKVLMEYNRRKIDFEKVFASAWKKDDIYSINLTTLILTILSGIFVILVLFSLNLKIHPSITSVGRTVSKGLSSNIRVGVPSTVKSIHAYNGARVYSGQILIELETTVGDTLNNVEKRLSELNIENDSLINNFNNKRNLINESLKIKEDLFKKGLISNKEVLDLKIILSNDVLSFEQSVAAIKQKIQELNGQRDGLLQRIKDNNIRSPVDGIVEDFNSVGVGSVISPSDIIMRVVPLNDIIVEAQLLTIDRDYVKNGQHVKLFKQVSGKRGGVEYDGTVEYISSDRQKEKEPTYRVIITPKDFIEIGATVNVVIPLQQTSLFNWLITPLIQGMNGSSLR